MEETRLPPIMKEYDMNSLDVTSVSAAGMDQHSITATTSLDSLPAVMGQVADAVSKKDAGILSQVVFVPEGMTGDGCRCLQAAFGTPKWPVAWLEFPDGDGTGLVSSQTFAVSGVPVQRLEMDGRIVGSFYESDAAEFCLLGSVGPSDLSAAPRLQCRQIFELIETALSRVDMTFHHVMRTWFYLDRILSWYGDFNDERSRFFAERGILHGPYPASTGVGMSNSLGASVICSALAVRPKGGDVRLQEVDSPKQCPAPDYRSAFSRAMEMAVPGCRSLHVSGTASIRPDGVTAHVGDVDRQIELTVEVVRSLLRSRRMDWPDVNRAVAYFTDLRDLPRLIRCLENRGISGMPLAIARADICRDDLLFEMEVEAAAGCGSARATRKTG
jgi:enamine deaminase RidA (YjgF/YER057c/UK114 family)